MNRVTYFIQQFMKKLPDPITGDTTCLRQKYQKLYSSVECEKMIIKTKTKITMIYLILVAIVTVSVLYSVVDQVVLKQEIQSIKRPESGQMAKRVSVDAALSYKEVGLYKTLVLNVDEKVRTKQEILQYLDRYEQKLQLSMLGENQNRKQICKPLYLPEYDADSGISIRWTIDQPEIISEDGQVNFIHAGGHKNAVKLQVELTYQQVSKRYSYEIIVVDSAEEDVVKKNLEAIINYNSNLLSCTTDGPELLLPDSFGDDVAVKWYLKNDSNLTILIPIALFAILIVYFKRYDRIDHEIKKAEESLRHDLPELIGKLVLLLNAGLVVSSAFEKIIKDHEHLQANKKKGKQHDRFLYAQLSIIQGNVNRSNTSLVNELKEFSQRCGVRELIRLTAVISENWQKGSALAEKLESERELLWMNRKKSAEEKGKLAETKLTLPLMLLLIILIGIVIAPAFFEM